MYKVWAHDPDAKHFMGAKAVADKLPSGMYKLETSMFGDPIAHVLSPREERIIDFQNGPLRQVLDEASRFWQSKDRYASLGVAHKRGILLYGPPGNGKTAIIGRLIQSMANLGGLTIQIEDLSDVRSALPLLQQIEGDRPVLLSLEDIDRWGNRCEQLLAMLDGSEAVGKSVLFVTTTNYLNKVSKRIRCRPSRIDTLIRVGSPRQDQRLEYLDFVLEGMNWNGAGLDLMHIAKETKGLSLAGVKEVLLSMVIYECDLAQAVKRVTGLEAGDSNDSDSDSEESEDFDDVESQF